MDGDDQEVGCIFRKDLFETFFYQATPNNTDVFPSGTSGDKRVEHLSSPIQQLQKNHARTMKSVEYDVHSLVFKKVAPILLGVNQSDKALKRKSELSRSKQQHMSEFVNRLWSMADAHYREQLKKDPGAVFKAPVILFGDGSSSSMKGQRSTNPAAMLDYLKHHFTVLVVQEHNSSQKCPKCWGQMNYLDGKGVRVKTCPNERCKAQPKSKKEGDPLPDPVDFIVNRDIAAPVNFLSIAIGLVMTGERPEPFQYKKSDTGKESSGEQETESAEKSSTKKPKGKKQGKQPKRKRETPTVSESDGKNGHKLKRARSKKTSGSKAKDEPTTSGDGSTKDVQHA